MEEETIINIHHITMQILNVCIGIHSGSVSTYVLFLDRMLIALSC